MIWLHQVLLAVLDVFSEGAIFHFLRWSHNIMLLGGANIQVKAEWKCLKIRCLITCFYNMSESSNERIKLILWTPKSNCSRDNLQIFKDHGNDIKDENGNYVYKQIAYFFVINKINLFLKLKNKNWQKKVPTYCM